MQIKDKVVVVTGASSGIGLEVARALVAEGAKVVFAARSLNTLRAEAERAGQAEGRALAVELDVTSQESTTRAIQQVLDRFGRIDVLINNAGNGGSLRRWAATDPSVMREMFEVHVLGAERVIRAVVPTMRAQHSGVVVSVASTVAWVPMPGAAAYSSAKAAVVALSTTLRSELTGDGIDVRVFSPPHSSTDAGKAWPLNLPRIFAPDWVAQQLVRSLHGRRARVTPGGNGFLLLLQRISPTLATRIMNNLGFDAVNKVEAAEAQQRALPAAPANR